MIYEKITLYKVLSDFWIRREWRHATNVQNISSLVFLVPAIFLLILWENNLLVAKFWIIKLSLDESEVIHANEHT